jgi:AI-2E family transporter
VGLSFLHSVTAGVGMIIIYVVYQQFENHVIQVAIMSRTVRLSPLGVLVSLLVGVQLFGLLGALLAIPAAGIIHVVGVDLYQERQSKRRQRDEDVAAEDVAAEGDVGPPGATPEATTRPDAPATPDAPTPSTTPDTTMPADDEPSPADDPPTPARPAVVANGDDGVTGDAASASSEPPAVVEGV